MINIEQAVNNKFPTFAQQPALLRKPTLSVLRKLIHEQEINQFLEDNKRAKSFAFVDRVFEYFDYSYSVNSRDKNNIPASGRVIIIANHPIGSLDGLALLKLVGEIRSDVKILANDMLSRFEAINDLVIPVDNMAGNSPRTAYKNVIQALKKEQAIIIFPAGEVSRARPLGVKDTRWLPGFLNFARKAKAPLLPIKIHANNSLLFYSASMIFKPLGTALLAHEMFNKQSRGLRFSIGEAIPHQALDSKSLHDRTLVKRLKRHLYKLGKRKQNPKFITEKTIVHPQDPKKIQSELKHCELLGETRDGNRIYLAQGNTNTALLQEIGRLREITFRKVGEGTGKKSDLDEYDDHYLHLVLWDRENLEIAGAYRLGVCSKILNEHGEKGLYTRSLYQFSPEFRPYLEQGLELGRSFVNPNYWGKASLDYLWQGLGAYLAKNPELRYLIGPISMSATYPKALLDTLAYYYSRYHACETPLATANNPYLIDDLSRERLAQTFKDAAAPQALELIQNLFSEHGHKLPVLFKQYTSLFEEGGFKSIVFSIDPDFGDCLDGLCMSDLTKIKAAKRKRYIR